MNAEEIRCIMNDGMEMPIECTQIEAIEIIAKYNDGLVIVYDEVLNETRSCDLEKLEDATEEEIMKIKDHFYVEERDYLVPIL